MLTVVHQTGVTHPLPVLTHILPLADHLRRVDAIAIPAEPTVAWKPGRDRKDTMRPDQAPPAPQAAERSAGKSALDGERDDLLDQIHDLLDPLMVGLGLLFLVLLLVDLSGLPLRPDEARWLNRALTAIWIAFVVDFAVRFLVAPAKGRYLRANWFNALTLVLPFLRPFRALRAVQTLRSFSLLQLLGGMNRGLRGLRRVTRGRQFAYVAALTIVTTLVGAVGVLYFDRGMADAPIQTFGEALWWAAGIITTIGNEEYAVSAEARVIGILLSVYAISVVGYVTASIASYLIGHDAAQQGTAPASSPITPSAPPDLAALHAEVAGLRDDLARLRQDLAARDDDGTSSANAVETTRAHGPDE